MSKKSKPSVRKERGRRSIQQVVMHAGDCSCYRYGCNICDCGALRRKVRRGTSSGNDPVWEAWAIHTSALDGAQMHNADLSDRAGDGGRA